MKVCFFATTCAAASRTVSSRLSRKPRPTKAIRALSDGVQKFHIRERLPYSLLFPCMNSSLPPWASTNTFRLMPRHPFTYEFHLTLKGKNVPFPIKKELLEIIVEANVDTDPEEIGKNQAYHYCTGLDNGETTEKAKHNYISTLSQESKKFYNKISKQKISLEDCKEALKILGHVNHMWQDYYAHGVERDDGEKAIIGKIQGSPDNPQMVPVSFGSMGFKGGHGGFWRLTNPFSRVEPDDSDTRKEQAKSYTKIRSDSFLSSWFTKCKCHFYREEINKHDGNCR